MRDVSIGQYYPAKSAVHRLDARTKIILVIAYIVMLFFVPTLNKYDGNVFSYMAVLAACYVPVLVFLILATSLSKVPLIKVLKSLKTIMTLVIITMVITLLFYAGDAEHMYFSYGIIKISLEGIVTAVAMALRLFFLVIGPSIMTLTTTPVELTDGIESLLKPLSYIKIPVHEFAMIMSIALRLIPTLSEETDKIISAQKARCADFDSGNIFKKAKAMVPILVPLLISSFRRADELANAMDSRCYRGAKGRTKMKISKMKFGDFFAFFVMTVILFCVLALVYDFFGVTTFLLSAVGL